MTAMTTFSGYSWNWGVAAMPPLSLRSILPQEQRAELLPQRRIEGPRYHSMGQRRGHNPRRFLLDGDLDLVGVEGHLIGALSDEPLDLHGVAFVFGG
jgi:hypothetical protein